MMKSFGISSFVRNRYFAILANRKALQIHIISITLDLI